MWTCGGSTRDARGRAGGRRARERASARASVGTALASSDISEVLELQLFIVTARTQKKGALACRRTRRLA